MRSYVLDGWNARLQCWEEWARFATFQEAETARMAYLGDFSGRVRELEVAVPKEQTRLPLETPHA